MDSSKDEAKAAKAHYLLGVSALKLGKTQKA